MKVIKFIIYGIIGIFIIIQLIPSNLPENNSDVKNDILVTESVSEEISEILHKACYDCHSNQTTYPWYSHVAPVSWLVASDTRQGREELNFSTWSELSKRRKIKILNEIAEEVEERNMPLKIYTVVHRDAILSDTEINLISNWTKTLSDQMLGEN
jgi:phosphoribosylformimino-5-aminoimidazole carboxamide ribonucleotide (ProFAR) isomerase